MWTSSLTTRKTHQHQRKEQDQWKRRQREHGAANLIRAHEEEEHSWCRCPQQLPPFPPPSAPAVGVQVTSSLSGAGLSTNISFYHRRGSLLLNHSWGQSGLLHFKVQMRGLLLSTCTSPEVLSRPAKLRPSSSLLTNFLVYWP